MNDLEQAIFSDDIKLVERKLDQRYSQNKLNDALKLAIKLDNLQMAKLLLNRGAVGNDKSVLTVLKSKNSDLIFEITRLLIEKGANVKVPGLISIAFEHSRLDLVRLLLDHGAIPHEKDLINIISEEHHNVSDIVEKMLESGISPNLIIKRYNISTLLIKSITSDNYENVEVLLKYGADLQLKSIYYSNLTSRHEDMSPLSIAVSLGNIKIAKLLLKYTPEINTSNPENSPVVIATSQGYIEILKLLVEYGANLNIRYGNTKHNLLQYAKNKETLKILLETMDTDISIQDDNNRSFPDQNNLLFIKLKEKLIKNVSKSQLLSQLPQDIIIDEINKTIYFYELYKIPFRVLTKTQKEVPEKPMIKAAVLCIPCNGFGDIIGAAKFNKYLKFIGINSVILTYEPDKFKSLGLKTPIESLKIKSGGESGSCYSISDLNLPEQLKQIKYDIIFIVPTTMAISPIYIEIKNLISSSSIINTYFVSEYNHKEQMDINLGIGKIPRTDIERDGIFTQKFGKPIHQDYKLTNNYAYMYITTSVFDYYICAINFIKMIIKKYQQYEKFSIICPGEIVRNLMKDTKTVDFIRNYYDKIHYVTKENNEVILNETGKTLYFRGDVFPVQYNVNIDLMINSVNDILVTGDQSLSDVISYSPQKTVWYQTVGWKTTLTRFLAQNIPNPHLSDQSCGNIDFVEFNHDSTNLIKQHSFNNRGLKKVAAAIILAKDPEITNKYFSVLNSPKTYLKLLTEITM